MKYVAIKPKRAAGKCCSLLQMCRKPADPPPPSSEEAALEDRVEQLRIRKQLEADADAEDVNDAGEMMTVAEVFESEENRLQQMKQNRLESASCALLFEFVNSSTLDLLVTFLPKLECSG
jgi:hypothetical protein